MTVAERYPIVCANCGSTTSRFTPFSTWLREHPQLDSKEYGFKATNIDYLWQRQDWRDGHDWYLFLEEKTRSGSVRPFQLRAFRWIASALARVGWVECLGEFRGFYVVTLDGTTPDDSLFIRISGWDGQGDYVPPRELSKPDLERFLKTGRILDYHGV